MSLSFPSQSPSLPSNWQLHCLHSRILHILLLVWMHKRRPLLQTSIRSREHSICLQYRIYLTQSFIFFIDNISILTINEEFLQFFFCRFILEIISHFLLITLQTGTKQFEVWLSLKSILSTTESIHEYRTLRVIPYFSFSWLTTSFWTLVSERRYEERDSRSERNCWLRLMTTTVRRGVCNQLWWHTWNI